MVKIKEFRIVVPMSLEEYEVALMYTIMKMEQQNTTGKEGIEILHNEPVEDEPFGAGQYTSKLYHFQSKVPSWLKSIAPANALIMQEESWTACQRSKTVIKCPYFNRFRITIDTIHKAENGCSENVHGLNNELLAARKVEILDIASSSTDYWSKAVGTIRVDLSKFRSMRTGRGPLSKGWKDRCDPVMTTYKLVTIDAPYWGFGNQLEEAMLAAERALFLELHRRCFALIDEWFGMSMEHVCQLERENDRLLKMKFNKKSLPFQKKEQDKQDPKETKEYVKHQKVAKENIADQVMEEGHAVRAIRTEAVHS